MLRKVLYGVLGVMVVALVGGLMFGSPCTPATAEELQIVKGFGARVATEGWRLERDGHTFVAVRLAAGPVVFGYGTLPGATKPIWSAVNAEARSFSAQGADIKSGSPAAEVVGLDDTEGIAMAEECAALKD